MADPGPPPAAAVPPAAAPVGLATPLAGNLLGGDNLPADFPAFKAGRKYAEDPLQGLMSDFDNLSPGIRSTAMSVGAMEAIAILTERCEECAKENPNRYGSNEDEMAAVFKMLLIHSTIRLRNVSQAHREAIINMRRVPEAIRNGFLFFRASVGDEIQEFKITIAEFILMICSKDVNAIMYYNAMARVISPLTAGIIERPKKETRAIISMFFGSDEAVKEYVAYLASMTGARGPFASRKQKGVYTMSLVKEMRNLVQNTRFKDVQRGMVAVMTGNYPLHLLVKMANQMYGRQQDHLKGLDIPTLICLGGLATLMISGFEPLNETPKLLVNAASMMTWAMEEDAVGSLYKQFFDEEEADSWVHDSDAQGPFVTQVENVNDDRTLRADAILVRQTTRAPAR